MCSDSRLYFVSILQNISVFLSVSLNENMTISVSVSVSVNEYETAPKPLWLHAFLLTAKSHGRLVRLPWFLEYSSTARVVNYSNSNFLLLEYSLLFISGLQIYISGCIFCSRLQPNVVICGTLGLGDFVIAACQKLIWICACRGSTCSRPWPFGHHLRCPTHHFFVIGSLY